MSTQISISRPIKLEINTTPITGGVVGRVLFEGTGNVVSESANLFWDNTNGRLGIGTSSPGTALNIVSSLNAAFFAKIQNSNSGANATTGYEMQSNSAYGSIFATSSTYTPYGVLGASQIGFYTSNTFSIALDSSSADFKIGVGTGAVERLRIKGNTGNVLINTTTDAGFKLDVNGTARVQTSLVLNGSSSLFSSTISAYQSGTNRILSLATSTAKTVSSVGSLFTINTNEASTPQSLNVQYIGATFINDRSYSLQTSETGVAFGGGIVLQKDGGWVNIGSSSQISSAVLSITSSTQGFLPPRMTTTQKNAIATPATGLMVYDTTLNLIALYNGTIWTTL